MCLTIFLEYVIDILRQNEWELSRSHPIFTSWAYTSNELVDVSVADKTVNEVIFAQSLQTCQKEDRPTRTSIIEVGSKLSHSMFQPLT